MRYYYLMSMGTTQGGTTDGDFGPWLQHGRGDMVDKKVLHFLVFTPVPFRVRSRVWTQGKNILSIF